MCVPSQRRKQAKSSLLEDINVEIGSVRVHLTLFDQKLLIQKLLIFSRTFIKAPVSSAC